ISSTRVIRGSRARPASSLSRLAASNMAWSFRTKILALARNLASDAISRASQSAVVYHRLQARFRRSVRLGDSRMDGRHHGVRPLVELIGQLLAVEVALPTRDDDGG